MEGICFTSVFFGCRLQIERCLLRPQFESSTEERQFEYSPCVSLKICWKRLVSRKVRGSFVV